MTDKLLLPVKPDEVDDAKAVATPFDAYQRGGMDLRAQRARYLKEQEAKEIAEKKQP